MPPAAIIGGVVGLASAGATVAAGSANSKAINKSADASLQANREALAAQEKAFNQSLAFQQNAFDQTQATGKTIYNTNFGMLQPFAANGLTAGNAMQGLLGLPAAQNTLPSQSPFAAPTQPPAQQPPAQTPPQPSTAPPIMGNGFMPWVQ